MQKGLWSPAWRLLTIGVGLLLVHSVWAYVEARRLEGAIRSIETRAVPGGRHPRESRLDDAARFYEAAWVLSPGI